MRKNFFTAIAAFAIGLVGPVETARAEVLILVDLSKPNEITFTATDGASEVTISDSNTDDIYLDNFFPDNLIGFIQESANNGDFTSSQDASVGSTNFYRHSDDEEDGLNVYSFTDDDSLQFTAGVKAFVGSVTWTVSDAIYAAAYAAAVDGDDTGDIYFPATKGSQFDTASIIGQWQFVGVQEVPLPAAIWLFVAGLGGLGFARRQKANV